LKNEKPINLVPDIKMLGTKLTNFHIRIKLTISCTLETTYQFIIYLCKLWMLNWRQWYFRN